ncbi:LutC/YkgG family protein [Arcanobacterium pinnipediorum]|uniref:LUD domain-containing protein n=1 Tax=Arcanobacterium pinnipediorum TaxID=1503041 RepID=A0ABY5AGV6_9ACTO|nr:LUD domain-containing protein [Arcanobacterium pinnipediorum]USR79434.1 LUD domain-containing protein [Arcanobacterium pinnipediorum]
MSAREVILQRIEDALALSQREPAGEPPRDYIREGQFPPGAPEVIEDLVEKLEDYTAVVVKTNEAGIADAIDNFLDDVTEVVVPSGLAQDWKEAARRKGRHVQEDSREQALGNYDLDKVDAVVTASRVAISMSGTIILDGEPDQGRRAITLVPDTHVIVLYAKDVYPTVSQAVTVLNEHPTRPITWIAGPSATSDIELVRVDGVHGPRNLRVIIVND